MSKRQQKLPPGWDDARIREVIAHYEDQTEDEQFAEIESAQDAQNVTMVAVPTELVPEVTALIEERWNPMGDRVPSP
jgi:hypothetical protein